MRCRERTVNHCLMSITSMGVIVERYFFFFFLLLVLMTSSSFLEAHLASSCQIERPCFCGHFFPSPLFFIGLDHLAISLARKRLRGRSNILVWLDQIRVCVSANSFLKKPFRSTIKEIWVTEECIFFKVVMKNFQLSWGARFPNHFFE